MYAITVFTDTPNGGVSAWVSFHSDKEVALDAFASVVQQDLFFLDENIFFQEFIEKYSRYHYSYPVNTLVYGKDSLRLGTYPEWMITAEYFDGNCKTYRYQMVECKQGLFISL